MSGWHLFNVANNASCDTCALTGCHFGRSGLLSMQFGSTAFWPSVDGLNRCTVKATDGGSPSRIKAT
ncbi:hypothetical protein AVEN_202223-1, partial [Araneus ventricosus]